MTDPTYTPPKVWTWDKESGGRFASINRPTAGPTHDRELPVGKHPLQLYSLGTPNGQKVTILLEELLEARGRIAGEMHRRRIKARLLVRPYVADEPDGPVVSSAEDFPQGRSWWADPALGV